MKQIVKNVKTIALILTSEGLNKFIKVPTFNESLHKNQIEGLTVGVNYLTINHYTYSHLLRIVDYDKSNMQIKIN